MIRGLYLVELAVADWCAAVAWYRDVLGLDILKQDPDNQFALFQAGDCRISLKGRASPRPGDTLLTFEVDDLAAELDRLSARNIVPEQPLKFSNEGYRRAILRDPDGHFICLFDWGNA